MTATPAPDSPPTGTAEPLLKVEGLRVSYLVDGTPREAVHGVSFEVNAGEVVAIVGESGSGKTTTAHAIINLLPGNARTDSGSVVFAGADLSRLTRKEWQGVRGRDIGLIPQDPTASLDPLQKVGPQVAEALTIHRLRPKKEARRDAVRLLAESGIRDAESRARQYPHQFSGGMRQRVLIASALAARPRLVIADEPTSALDVTIQRQILDNIAALTAERGTAVLLITHDLGVAADRADRIIVMRRGEIVETGAAAQVLGSPRHAYTRQLIAAAPGLSPQRLRPAGEAVTGRATGDPADPGPSARPLVQARNLRKVFHLPRTAKGPRTLTAVNDVSVEILRGETLALVGESGSGKSTVARLLLRLDKPTSGSVTFDGEDLTTARGERLRQLRRRFQVVFQSPYASLDPHFTVEDSVAEPLRAFGEGTPSDRRARVAALLDAVHLPADYGRRHPAELSGGQRQRVAIARALALRPELVVLDEAVSALDVSVQAQILALLSELQGQDGLSYLFISHDLAVVQQISDRVAVMRGGELLEAGTTEAVLERPEHGYTRELISAVPGRRTLQA
ncbi:ABC transporter related [Pseudarthrobacter chlorophenolicus A6]|uniref:ABC transporter related n=1 Tax=Pseudarthrobacter chlorophenolicus (strain ATCC 700700 / DSM 12829 / CIP 107037 / JCM 12360 / KCTC 9906 / NCIMB 13794 / A6) TaxID=452863 RepID=B8H9R4_PSECP|nr:ABC transporter ATP-binding protein [Pseudarthrobacter chlorophenolicus]ACL38298.1 ABC transporter related [Pseudarthrobacter chlorophenolicus A6]SDQ51466.1 peptide/nickel transport system ATP-binding protein [Pseudarthrobacter chlorophenolicus]